MKAGRRGWDTISPQAPPQRVPQCRGNSKPTLLFEDWRVSIPHRAPTNSYDLDLRDQPPKRLALETNSKTHRLEQPEHLRARMDSPGAGPEWARIEGRKNLARVRPAACLPICAAWAWEATSGLTTLGTARCCLGWRPVGALFPHSPNLVLFLGSHFFK